MSQKSLVDSMKKRATMQGSAEEKRCRSLVLKDRRNLIATTLKTVLEFKASLIAASQKQERNSSLRILKNIQPISVGV
jgi:hypothetical protein